MTLDQLIERLQGYKESAPGNTPVLVRDGNSGLLYDFGGAWCKQIDEDDLEDEDDARVFEDSELGIGDYYVQIQMD